MIVEAPKPIQMIHSGNVNLQTGKRPSVMDLIHQTPTNTPPVSDAAATDHATSASQLDSVAALLTATAKAGKHFINLHDSCREMERQVREIDAELCLGDNLPFPRLQYLSGRKSCILKNLRAELLDMAKQAVILADMFTCETVDPCQR